MGMDVADEGGDYNSVALRYGGFVAPIRKWRGLDVDMSSLKAVSIFAEVEASVAYIESDGLGAAVSPRMRREYYWKCHTCGATFYDKSLDGTTCPACVPEDGKKRVPLEQVYVSAIKVMVGSAPSEDASIAARDLGQFGCLRDQLWWSLREWLRKDPTAMLPPSETLQKDLLAMTFEVKNGKLKVTSKEILRGLLGGRSPDEADALIETFYARDVPRVRNLWD